MKGVDMVRREKLIALILGCIMAFSVSGAASALEWGSKEIETEKLAVQFTNQVMKGGYKIVTTEELKVWMDKKDPMLIVDTMPFEDSYKKNHIPGAVQIEFPVEEMSQLDEAKKVDLEKILGPDKNRKIVFYCGFTKCGRSHSAAMWATKLGYTNVYRQPGGIKAWMEADYPVEKQNN
jgi:rhodanese-related sulfurtransferase